MEKLKQFLIGLNDALNFLLFNEGFSLVDMVVVILLPSFLGSASWGFVGCMVWFWVFKPYVLGPLLKIIADNKKEDK